MLFANLLGVLRWKTKFVLEKCSIYQEITLKDCGLSKQKCFHVKALNFNGWFKKFLSVEGGFGFGVWSWKFFTTGIVTKIFVDFPFVDFPELTLFWGFPQDGADLFSSRILFFFPQFKFPKEKQTEEPFKINFV